MDLRERGISPVYGMSPRIFDRRHATYLLCSLRLKKCLPPHPATNGQLSSSFAVFVVCGKLYYPMIRVLHATHTQRVDKGPWLWKYLVSPKTTFIVPSPSQGVRGKEQLIFCPCAPRSVLKEVSGRPHSRSVAQQRFCRGVERRRWCGGWVVAQAYLAAENVRSTMVPVLWDWHVGACEQGGTKNIQSTCATIGSGEFVTP